MANGMVKYKVEFDLEVLPFDQNLAPVIPDIIRDRFQGTAIRVSKVTITKQEDTA